MSADLAPGARACSLTCEARRELLAVPEEAEELQLDGNEPRTAVERSASPEMELEGDPKSMCAEPSCPINLR